MSVQQKKVCLELLIFILLNQISSSQLFFHLSLSALSQLSLSSLSTLSSSLFISLSLLSAFLPTIRNFRYVTVRQKEPIFTSSCYLHELY